MRDVIVVGGAFGGGFGSLIGNALIAVLEQLDHTFEILPPSDVPLPHLSEILTECQPAQLKLLRLLSRPRDVDRDLKGIV